MPASGGHRVGRALPVPDPRQPQGERAVANAAGIADAIGRIGGDVDGVARRTHDVMAGRVVFENTPLSGSTTRLRSCRSTSPQASEVGRASNRPICSVSLSNSFLRVTSTA